MCVGIGLAWTPAPQPVSHSPREWPGNAEMVSEAGGENGNWLTSRDSSTSTRFAKGRVLSSVGPAGGLLCRAFVKLTFRSWRLRRVPGPWVRGLHFLDCLFAVRERFCGYWCQVRQACWRAQVGQVSGPVGTRGGDCPSVLGARGLAMTLQRAKLSCLSVTFKPQTAHGGHRIRILQTVKLMLRDEVT